MDRWIDDGLKGKKVGGKGPIRTSGRLCDKVLKYNGFQDVPI